MNAGKKSVQSLPGVAAMAIILCAGLALAQNYSPPEGSALARKVHPRIYLVADDLPNLRQRILRNYAVEFQTYVNALDAVFNETPASKVRNLLLMDGQNYAFLYLLDPARMTGITFSHTRAEYGRKAIAHAMAARNLQGSDRGDTHTSAKLESSNGAHHNLGIATVYDWTFPLLTLEEKRALADALIQLYEERDEDAEPGLYQKLSNQVTGYIHHGCAAALAIWGDELGPTYTSKAQEMLNFFDAVFLQRTLETGDRVFEGPGWSEGASYYFLGMTNVSFMAGAASSALGRNLFYETDFLRRNVLYAFYNTLPLKLRGHYYLSRHDTNSLQPVIDHNISRLLAISAGALRTADPDMAGLAKWMLTQGGLGLDVKNYQYYKPRLDDLFSHFLWGYKETAAKSPQSLNLPPGLKLGLGQVVMKSSFDKETSTHVIFWAPKFWYSPHAHKDIASFTIYKHGSLAVDAGNSKNADDFPDCEGSSEAVFHNILGLYDPDGSDRGYNYMDFDFSPEGAADHWRDPEFAENGRNHVGNLLGFESMAEYDFADYDYTRVYSASRCTFARRRMAYLRGPENQEFVVIHDVVDSPQEKRFLLHTAFEPAIANDVITVTNDFDRAHGRMFVKAVLPASRQILKVGGPGKWFVEADWKPVPQDGPFVDWGAYWTGSYRFEIRSNEGEFLTVMQLGDSQALTSMAPVEKIMSANLSGSLIAGNRLVMLGRTPQSLGAARYTLTANGLISHLVAGLVPDARAKVYRNGVLLLETETSKAGAVYFKDNASDTTVYRIVVGQVLAVDTPPQALPTGFALGQNYPNPFVLETADAEYRTAIPYRVHEARAVNLQVFDMTGRLIRTLVAEHQAPGEYQIYWNGMGDDDRPAPAGLYLYRMQAGQFAATKKMVLLRRNSAE